MRQQSKSILTVIRVVINPSKIDVRDIVKQRINEKQREEERKGKWYYRIQIKLGK